MFGKLIASLRKNDADGRRKQDLANAISQNEEARLAFEEAYAVASIENSDYGCDEFHISTADAISMTKGDASESVDELVAKIVDELVSLTDTWAYDGTDAHAVLSSKAFDESRMLGQRELSSFTSSLPKELRPQLTGMLATVDLDHEQSLSIIELLAKAKRFDQSDMHYNLFRQGLDIVDLNPTLYAMLGRNLNSMGYWLPFLVSANDGKGFFRIPKTTIARVPLTLLQLTRLEYASLNSTTKQIINAWASDVFDLDVEKGDYFVKSGTASSKFDFRNAHVFGDEVRDLGEYLVFNQHRAVQMASPLNNRTIYGMSTTNEFVVREFIESADDCMSIYHGLPLRTEYRVFVDCDEGKVLGMAPYWHPNVMKRHFDREAATGNVDALHDSITFRAEEPKLMARYAENKARVEEEIARLLPDLTISGQWSIDVMQNGDEFLLIDMAQAGRSALVEYAVDRKLLKPCAEPWLPTDWSKAMLPAWKNGQLLLGE